MTGLRGALGLLTILPAGGPHDVRAAAGWFAPVGMLLGALSAVAALGAFELWGTAAAAAVVVAVLTVLTGALHLDGAADTADAAFAPVHRERRLEILRDVHHGTFAVVAVTVILLLKFGALAGLGRDEAMALVFVAPVVSRATVLPAMRQFPPARREGMGAASRPTASGRAIAVGLLVAAGVSAAALGWQGVMLTGGGFAIAMPAAAWLSARLGGLTGDTYGAIIETSEVAVLLGGSAMLVQGWADPFPIGGWL